MKHLLGPVFVSVALAACGDTSSPGAPDAATVDPTPDAANVFTSTFSWAANDEVTNDPVQGARTCFVGLGDTPSCGSAGADGGTSIPVSFPNDRDLLVQAVTTAFGYLGCENDFVIPRDATILALLQFGGLYTDAEATDLLATHAGFTYPSPDTGFLVLEIFGSDSGAQAPHATVAVAPLDGGTTGAHAVYTAADGVPDTALVDTGTEGGIVYVGNLAPGTYEVTVTSPGRTCDVKQPGQTVNGEWPGTHGASVDVHISAGVMTQHPSVVCR